MTFLDSLTSDLQNFIGGNNIFGGNDTNNTSTNPITDFFGSLKDKVDGFKNLGTWLLVGGGIVAVIIIMK